jgi:hypothetical protein
MTSASANRPVRHPTLEKLGLDRFVFNPPFIWIAFDKRRPRPSPSRSRRTGRDW